MMDLRKFIKEIDGWNELVSFAEKFSPVYEIPSALKELDSSGGYACLFENVEGYEIPVVGNLFSNRKRIEKLMGTGDIIDYCRSCIKSPVTPEILKDGESQEQIDLKELDICRRMPVLTHHAGDAGPYLTSAIVIARDPVHGNYSMGIHRLQVKGKDKLGIFITSPPASTYLANAEKMGVPLDVAIVIGPDPELFFASVMWIPQGADKIGIAGALAKNPVKLVKALTVDINVPASAEFILEGYVVPGVREEEGPFGEESGVYHTSQNPVVKLTAITSKKKPIYQALMPFAGEGSTLMAVAWELNYFDYVKSVFPNIVSVRVHPFDWTAITVQMKKRTDEQPKRVIEYFFQTSPYIKSIVVVDDDINPLDPQDISWAISSRCQPADDIVIKDGFPASMIDPSRKNENVTSKIGIDATTPLANAYNYRKIRIPPEVSERIGIICSSKLKSAYLK